jgi:long-subunit acyl-CoA synthetase (AMP-forming)
MIINGKTEQEGCTPYSKLLQENTVATELPDLSAIRPKEDAAVYLFSSGTTGVPKAVELTHWSLIGEILSIG